MMRESKVDRAQSLDILMALGLRIVLVALLDTLMMEGLKTNQGPSLDIIILSEKSKLHCSISIFSIDSYDWNAIVTIVTQNQLVCYYYCII